MKYSAFANFWVLIEAFPKHKKILPLTFVTLETIGSYYHLAGFNLKNLSEQKFVVLGYSFVSAYYVISTYIVFIKLHRAKEKYDHDNV